MLSFTIALDSQSHIQQDFFAVPVVASIYNNTYNCSNIILE